MSDDKKRYYYKQIGDFRRELREAIPRDVLRDLHRPVAWKHFTLLLRQTGLATAAIYLAVRFDSPWIWFPCAVVLGFIIFDCTVLLHEAVHYTIFKQRRPFATTLMGWLYALPCGISRAQFTRWHLDHHNELGSNTGDPKRAHLTPKIVTRRYKFLYLTPALFPIYFRGAARESATYPKRLQRTIALERWTVISIHALTVAGIITFGGIMTFVKIYAVPYFFIFPIAFTLNRMGQHYNIDPSDAAQWTTLIKGHWFWNFVFLYSNHHLEHHYFPGVPCYNLPRLQALLWPLYNRHGMRPQTYRAILYGWFIENRTPHTKWD